MSLELLEREIRVQNEWDEEFQKDFIKDCLKAQGEFQRVKRKDIDTVHQAFIEKVLGDESIQYYTRIFLNIVYSKF